MENHKKNIDAAFSDLSDYNDHLTQSIETAKRNKVILNLPSFINWNQLLKSKIDQASESYKILVEKEKELIEKSASFSRLYTDCKSLRHLSVKFAEECKNIITEFECLEEEFAHKDIYEETSPFRQLINSSNAWKRFMEEYDNMVKEIKRRSFVQKRNEMIMKAYQKELDRLALEEEKERARFSERYLNSEESSLPEAWKSISLLKEPVIYYKIESQSEYCEYPSFIGDSDIHSKDQKKET